MQVHLAVDLGASSGRVIAGWLVNDRLKLEEVHRFDNEPVQVQGTLQWNVLGLWSEILKGLRLAGERYDAVASVGVDSWGVDYVLLDENEQMAGPVRHYRDGRTEGMVERAIGKLGRDVIFEATGLQFMPINTLYQLFSAAETDDRCLDIADSFLMIGDFFHWLLTGKQSIEATNASTTQMLHPLTRKWNVGMLETLRIPARLFRDVTQPATTLGPLQPSVAEWTGLHEVPVVVPATHDTASAILSVPAEDFAPANPNWCYISSGTWSLMGCEIPRPLVNEVCSELNFTNEGGVAGSTRLLKNIGGLWVFQQIRKSMQRRGRDVDWAAMVEQAMQSDPFGLLIDPDDDSFVAPSDMVDAIDTYAERTSQPIPTSDGTYFRAALEGLALRYRVCLQMLERLLGHRIETIHVVGGGANNELLCQMTADACHRTVIAGPVEATAIGNLLMQMIGSGVFGNRQEDMAGSIKEARTCVRDSFEVKSYLPQFPESWIGPAERFEKYSESTA
ncbi:MAG: rhamnulokinase family protein [Planctomycetota bacterium]